MIPEAGERFGPYEILGRLGGGAMGVVFRAWDARLHREVAIKLLHDDYQMPGMRERFLQEARAASALNHPNICTVFDLGEQDGEPYMVMELLQGETLKEKISRGAVAADEIISCAQEVADALAVAHAKGIVHRDIKPANIFLVDQPNGRRQAKVLDFGLAKIGLAMPGGRASRALDLTLAGATVGTLSYMSPEQARGQVLDERSDLFSLGVVMYEMATRQVPFKGATSALIFVQLLNHPPEPLHEWNESIPKDLEKIVLKLLSKERDGRFQTANDLAKALRKIPFRSGGGWLKRAASAAVPLVRASDPVARAKRPARTDSSPNRPVVKEKIVFEPVSDGPVAARALNGRLNTGADNTLIRPVARALRGEGGLGDAGLRDEGVLRGDRTISERAALERSVAVSSSDQIPAAEVLDGPLGVAKVEAKQSVEAVVVPARSRSGATQFEFGVAGAEAEAAADARAMQFRERMGIERRNLPRVQPVLAAKPEPEQKDETTPSKLRFALVAGLLAAVTGGGFALVNSGRLRSVVLQPGDPMLLTVVQNKTGDKALDGSVLEGLEVMLDQSGYLSIQGGEAYRAVQRQAQAEGQGSGPVSSRKIAQMVGAKAYLYGEISGQAPYTISVDVLKTESNDKLTSIVEEAADKDAVAAAIGRIARRVRADMGEPERSIVKTDVALESEASGKMEALQAYSDGDGALERGKVAEAIAGFEKAVAADPKFALAHLRLGWLYRAEKAETAAATEAKLAMDAAESGSERLKLLTQFGYEMNATADYGRAAGVVKQFKELYPHAEAGDLALARVLRTQGELPEALQAAQAAYSENPYDAEAYVEAEMAMLGMDRYQGVLELDDQARRLGVTPDGSTMAAAYLGGVEDVLTRETAALDGTIAGVAGTGLQASYGRLTDYGLYLDNEGRLTAGTAFWSGAAKKPESGGALASTGAYLLAQSAKDRALTKQCGTAMGFAKEADALEGGLTATFDAGMAAALCGDKVGAEKAVAELEERFPKSTAVKDYYVADLQAALALAANDPKAALTALGGAAPYDQVSLTAYLRGLAHLGAGETALAVADFQTIVDHRGAAFVAGSNVYPMAQIGLARAYGAMGDKANSTTAYRRFEGLWQQADKGQMLLSESAAKGK